MQAQTTQLPRNLQLCKMFYIHSQMHVYNHRHNKKKLKKNPTCTQLLLTELHTIQGEHTPRFSSSCYGCVSFCYMHYVQTLNWTWVIKHLFTSPGPQGSVNPPKDSEADWRQISVKRGISCTRSSDSYEDIFISPLGSYRYQSSALCVGNKKTQSLMFRGMC